MIKTKNIISGIIDIPREWIFENYLTLPEILNGQNVKIKSPFNLAEKNPSFFVYFCKTSQYYKFKDFSSGQSGDAVELVKLLLNYKTRSGATKKIISDYQNFLGNTDGKVEKRTYIPQEQYKVVNFIPRNWNEIDKNFWTPFGITSSILKKYKVVPLKEYTIEKKLEDGRVSTVVLDKALMYGYFTEKGLLYKIYQPYVKNTKFFKVLDYIQGTDQLSKTKPNLVICSSLKDIMGMEALKFKSIDMIAPNSENTLIDEHLIKEYKERYNHICTLFDNDKAGINSMQEYKNLYGIESAHLKLDKDLTDAIRTYGLSTVKIHLYPLLTKALFGKANTI